MGCFDSGKGGLSLLTGGIGDLFAGKPIGAGVADSLGNIFPEGTMADKIVPSVIAPVETGMSDIGKRVSEGGPAIDVFSDVFERMADPTNSVNYSLEQGGSVLPESVRGYLPAAGGVVGGAVGGPGFAALGSGVGSHLAGKSSTESLENAGLSAVLSSIFNLFQEAPTAAQAATKVADPEASFILKDMGEALKPGYAGGSEMAAPVGAGTAPLITDLEQTGVPENNKMQPANALTEPNAMQNLSVDEFLTSGLPMNYTDSMWGPQSAQVMNTATTLPVETIPDAPFSGGWGTDYVSPDQIIEEEAAKASGKSIFGKAGDLITKNPKTSAFIAMNLLNSLNQANMTKGVNEAQQKSWQDYLNAINPTPAVKQTQYNTLAGNVDTQTALSRKATEDALAARGIRGKGAAAPMGDVSEASRLAKNAAYNKIFGTYNVPSSPGPANYSPSAGNLAVGNAAQLTNYLLPLYQMMQQYGGVTK